MSAKTGRAPARRMALAEAKKLKGVAGLLGEEGADVGRGEGEPEGVGSTGAADGVRDGAGLGGGVLELRDLQAEDEALGGADTVYSVHHLVTNQGELAGEVQHRDGLEGGLGERLGGGNRGLGHMIMLQVRLLERGLGDGRP
jgi:hypothetical protein